MIEAVLGGVFGGLLRLAPEVLKFFDTKNERQHELNMLDKEMEFAKVRGEIQMREANAVLQSNELDAIISGLNEQSSTAKEAGKFIAAVSALVRPMITYLFVVCYFAVKMASYLLALDQGGNWKDVTVSLWTTDDVSILFMIISFWFVGRTIDRNQGKIK